MTNKKGNAIVPVLVGLVIALICVPIIASIVTSAREIGHGEFGGENVTGIVQGHNYTLKHNPTTEAGAVCTISTIKRGSSTLSAANYTIKNCGFQDKATAKLNGTWNVKYTYTSDLAPSTLDSLIMPFIVVLFLCGVLVMAAGLTGVI